MAKEKLDDKEKIVLKNLIVIGASAAILLEDKKGKKILLPKRTEDTERFPGYFTFPGGLGESIDKNIEDTVTREVREEVGLKFIPTEKFGFYESKWKKTRVISLVFLGTWKGRIKIQKEEISDFKWFTYAEAIEQKLAFAYREVIEDLHKKGLL